MEELKRLPGFGVASVSMTLGKTRVQPELWKSNKEGHVPCELGNHFNDWL